MQLDCLDFDKNKTNLEVWKDNKLIEGHCNLTLAELRVMNTVLSTIYQHDDPTKMYTVDVSLYCELFNISREQALKEIKVGAADLLEHIITIEEPEGYVMFQWVSKVYIEYGNPIVQIQWHETISHFIFGLKKYFTSYSISDLLLFKTPLTLRIYELCRAYEHKGKYSISIKDFKDILGITTKYRRTSSLYKDLIQVAVSIINRGTDMTVTATLGGRTSKATYILFIIDGPKTSLKYEKDIWEGIALSKWSDK